MASQRERSLVARLAYMPRPDGPHARLGVVWFVVACVAAALGTIAVAALFAGLAAVAAMQTLRAWSPKGPDASRLLVGAAAAAVPVCSLIGPIGFALGAAISLALALCAAAIAGTGVGAFAAIRSSFLLGVAAGAVVIIARADMGAFVVVLILVSAYEIGDYLMGADAGSVFEGPLSGIAAVLVVTFAEAVFQLGPFETRAAWIFGGLVAVLAPLGAPLASALAPTAEAAGPAVRRLDAWLVVAPVWAWLLVDYLARVR